MSLPQMGGLGIDEAGRGPLAGPVVVAAVRFPTGVIVNGLNDSKKLSSSKRASLCAEIVTRCHVSVQVVSPERIDELNILQATFFGMTQAVAELWNGSEPIWIDGNQIPRNWPTNWKRAAQAVVKGDGKVAEVAAASIVAKVTRDRYMVDISADYHGYGFESHFGYPSPAHLAALKKLGPCPIHRKSYAPVAACMPTEEKCPRIEDTTQMRLF